MSFLRILLFASLTLAWSTDIYEPDNSQGTAIEISQDETLIRDLPKGSGDVDWLKFDVDGVTGGLMKVPIGFIEHGWYIDYDLWRADQNGNLTSIFSTSSESTNLVYEELWLEAGTYYIRLKEYFNYGAAYTFYMGTHQPVYTWKLTSEVEGNGRIIQAGDVYEEGSSPNIIFYTDEGYVVDSVFVNGTFVGTPTDWRFAKETISDQHVRVVYAPATGLPKGSLIEQGSYQSYLDGTNNYQFVLTERTEVIIQAQNKYNDSNMDLFLRKGSSNIKFDVRGTSLQLVKTLDPGTYTIKVVNHSSQGHPFTLRYYNVSGDPSSVTVSASSSEGGSLSTEGDVVVSRLSSPIYEVIPDEGYVLDYYVIDSDTIIIPTNQIQLTLVGQDKSIHAQFRLKNIYSISAVTNGMGQIAGFNLTEISEGDSVVFNFAPDVDSELLSLIVNGDTIGANKDVLVIRDITQDIEIVANFTPEPTSAIELASSEGGSLSQEGRFDVLLNSKQKFYVNIQDEYLFDFLVINGDTNFVHLDSFELNASELQYEIFIQFKAKDIFQVKLNTTGDGTAVIIGESTRLEGDSLVVEIQANLDSELLHVLVNGDTLEFIGDAFTIKNIQTDLQIKVVFSETPIASNIQKSQANANLMEIDGRLILNTSNEELLVNVYNYNGRLLLSQNLASNAQWEIPLVNQNLIIRTTSYKTKKLETNTIRISY